MRTLGVSTNSLNTVGVSIRSPEIGFSVASPMETIGFKTKSDVFGNIQVYLLKGRDGEHAVDPTLSIEGDSADAKATGDAISALDDRLDTAESAVSGLDDRLDTAESSISGLDDRLDTAESSITSLETSVSGLATVSGHKLVITLPTT